jgi:hypothetical protein
MRKNMVRLRILGIAAFLLFIISMFVYPNNNDYNFTQIRQVLMFISFGSFAIVIFLHLYKAYLDTFVKKEESDS